MTTASNSNLDRNKTAGDNKNEKFDKAKCNDDAISLGNRHGSISFGHIHQRGDVTSSCLIQAPDARHFFSVDKETGDTTSVSPGRLNLRSGIDIDGDDDSMMLHSESGNIIIKADNGSITFIADSIDMYAIGAEGKGDVHIGASNNFSVDAKKVLINAKSMYKIATSGTGEIVANSVLKLYGSLIRGVTDGCSLKDGKYGGMAFQKMNTLL